MAAGQRVVLTLAAARFGPIAAGPAQMVGSGVHELIKIRIKILAKHALIMRARPDVPQMPDHIVGKERLSVIVPIQSPGVRGTFRDNFKNVLRWMIAPDRKSVV